MVRSDCRGVPNASEPLAMLPAVHGADWLSNVMGVVDAVGHATGIPIAGQTARQLSADTHHEDVSDPVPSASPSAAPPPSRAAPPAAPTPSQAAPPATPGRPNKRG